MQRNAEATSQTPSHDHGLFADLERMRRLGAPRQATFRPSALGRRSALKLLGGAGLGVLVAGCSSSGSTAASSTTAPKGATTSAPGGSENAGKPLEKMPPDMAGPFPGDGTNGPNVLDKSEIVRSDITKSFGEFSGTAVGVPLQVDLAILNASDGAPKEGAALYIWHSDVDGNYSLYSEGVTDQNYLRGVQVADKAGKLTFQTIYPSVYPGRWPHLHFEIYESVDAITSGARPILISQIAMLEDVSREVYDADDRYAKSKTNLTQISLAKDLVFKDGVALQTPKMSGSIDNGLALNLNIGV